MAEPVRTCIGCRTRTDKSDLVRLAWNGRLVVDVQKVVPGRGAYLHRDLTCVQLAIRRRAVARALRVPSADLDERVLEGIE